MEAEGNKEDRPPNQDSERRVGRKEEVEVRKRASCWWDERRDWVGCAWVQRIVVEARRKRERNFEVDRDMVAVTRGFRTAVLWLTLVVDRVEKVVKRLCVYDVE